MIESDSTENILCAFIVNLPTDIKELVMLLFEI